tara:strand:- start:3370 stop:3558 length:189 start_codon:yes stop_codon:yes gene_type:complete
MELKERVRRSRILEQVKKNVTDTISSIGKKSFSNNNLAPKKNSAAGLDLNRKKNIAKNKKGF